VAVAAWEHNLTDYNEGLGLVYERLVLNDYLERLARAYDLRQVIEAPLYGMAGVSGINSVHLARLGCEVTLVDDNERRMDGVRRIWRELSLTADFTYSADMRILPYPDASFDLAWQWAGLWHLPDSEALLTELCRVSRGLVFVAMPNPRQPGYLLRKYLVEPEFFSTIDERWTSIGRVRRVLEARGYRVIERGVMDVPPWPDTVMPVAQLLRRLGIRSAKLQRHFSGAAWQWSTMDYYLGRRPELREMVMKHAWLERSSLPVWAKGLWAHHRYLLATRAAAPGGAN
jgi:SAM-dependent methyltransferase